MNSHTPSQASLLRNFTFGVEDSLASTVGLLSGIASTDAPRSIIVVTGLILIFTEAMSMGVGSFLSEQSEEEYAHHRDLPAKRYLPDVAVMFFSYLGAGLIPIFPYMFLPHPTALITSVALALVSLTLLGVINANLSHTPVLKSAWRMFVLGGSVAIAGVLVGHLLKGFGP